MKIKIRSLYTEIVIMLLISAAASFVFFCVMDSAANTVIDNYIEKSEYLKKCSDRRAEIFRDYINKNSVSTNETGKIDKWLSRHREVSLIVTDKTKVIYSDNKSSEAEYDFYGENHFMRYETYEMDFADKTVTVHIGGMFDYSLYMMTTIMNILLSAALFMLIFLIAIRKKIQYIRKLRQEIQLLEGGSLDCRITVSGNDELSELAEGLDAMRISFIKQMENAEYLSRTNNAIVTEVSHDLRTPLTAVLLYSEILQNNLSLTDEQRNMYIGKIIKKLRHMEELSEHLLRYTSGKNLSVNDNTENETMPVKEALFDELSELCGYLTEQGFEVSFNADWRDVDIYADDESVSRIMGNISSNICRYADKKFPVDIRIDYSKSHALLRIENTVLKNADKAESKGIGTESISDTVRRIGGNYLHLESDDKYITGIEFMICP